MGNNRIGDSALGFEAAIPRGFVYQRSTVNGGVVLVSLSQAPLLGPEIVTVRPASVDYPDLAEKSVAEVESFFEGATDTQWERTEAKDCTLRYISRDGSVFVGVAYWGRGKGVTALGASSRAVSAAVEALVSKLSLSEGACDWPEAT